MTKKTSKKGFSLLELIIASILVVIVVLGIFSVNYVLSNNNQDYGQRYFVKSETQTTLNHILNNASLAIGSGTKDNFNNPDYGILYVNVGAYSAGDPNTFCIHQDIPPAPSADSTTVNPTPGTPPSYTNSRWLCYTWYPSTDLTYPYQILYCTFTYVPATSSGSFRGAAKCNAASAPQEGPIYLGTAQSLPTISFNTPPGTGFQVTSLHNCLDNTQAKAACGTSDNPDVNLSGGVFPAQEGF